MEKKLPKGWVETEVGNILKLHNGYAFKSSEYSEKGIPIIRISDIKNGKVCTDEAINIDLILVAADFIIAKGDVLVAMSGATTGKFGIFNEEITAYQNQRVGNLRPHSAQLTDRKFLFYLFGSLQREVEDKAYGGAQPNISSKMIEGFRFGLPPKLEQDRIVKKLDSLFSELEIVKEKMSRVPKLLKQFRQAVLTQAVTGKLTEDWRYGREFGNIEDDVKVYLKERLLLEHTPAKINSVNVIINEKDVDEFLIPSEWCFRNLNKLCTAFTYGSSSKSLDSGDVPVLRMGNLQNGEIDWSNLKYSSNETEISKYMLNSGDVLFNRTNSPELVGKTSVVRSTRKALYAGYLIKIWNGRLLNSYYLNFVLNSPYAKEWCWRVKSDGVSQSNINAQKLAHFSFPLPSIEEQQEIVKRVESLFKKADVIQECYSNLKHQFEQLPQAILTKAFSGELVEQLPTDGDAKDLLKEILKLKEELSQKKKPVKKSKSVKKKLSSSDANLEAEYPLYSILTNIIDGCSEEKLFTLSKMPQHKFLLQLDIELEKKVIIYKNDNVLIVNPKYNEN